MPTAATRSGVDAPLGGVTVTLVSGGPDRVLGTLDDVTVSTTTAADGSYRSSNLSPNSYRVTASTPSGTTPSDDRDITPDGTTTLVLASGYRRRPMPTSASAVPVDRRRRVRGHRRRRRAAGRRDHRCRRRGDRAHLGRARRRARQRRRRRLRSAHHPCVRRLHVRRSAGGQLLGRRGLRPGRMDTVDRQ